MFEIQAINLIYETNVYNQNLHFNSCVESKIFLFQN